MRLNRITKGVSIVWTEKTGILRSEFLELSVLGSGGEEKLCPQHTHRASSGGGEGKEDMGGQSPWKC